MQITTGKTINFGNVTESVKRITDATTRMIQDNLNSNLQWFTEVGDILGTGFGQGKKMIATPALLDVIVHRNVFLILPGMPTRMK